jgi:1,4-dihydroxy-2-naphthoyl-CoA hydrolase
MTGFDTAQLRSLMPFIELLDVRVDTATREHVILELDWRPELCTASGVMHGGALMTLADSASATCAFLNLPDGAAGTTTVESKINLLAPVRAGVVSARSVPLHTGRRFIVLETELRTSDDVLVGKTMQTQAVL